MVILSQDRSEIVNFDEMFRLYIDNWSDEDFPTEPTCFCIRAEKSGDHMTSVFLGEYATMKRAKEVLQETINGYENWEIMKAGLLSKIYLPIYKMPEE